MFTVTRAAWPSLQSLRTEIGYNYDSVMGRYISIYYGSFMRTCGYLPLPALRKRIENTLKHEFRHHLESQGGQRDLEIIDDTQIQEYKNQSVSRVNPEGE